jgi:hypothetical protein
MDRNLKELNEAKFGSELGALWPGMERKTGTAGMNNALRR